MKMLLMVLFSGLAMGCTCSWTGPLVQVGPRAQVVVRARVLSYGDRSREVDRSMTVEVLEVIKGTTARQIRIWGDDGAQCRPYVSTFPIGTEWVFAINRQQGRPDYAISVCGEFWARVEGDSVRGWLTTNAPPLDQNPPDRITIEVLRRLLR